MMMRHALGPLLLTTLALTPASSEAETVENNFLVHLSVTPSCHINAGGLPQKKVPTQHSGGDLDVACSKGVSYEVGLSGHNNLRTIRSAHGSSSAYALVPEREKHSLEWSTTRILGATGADITFSHRVLDHTPNVLGSDQTVTTRIDEITITLTF